MAHDVMISYASGDKPIADAVCARLESQRIRCWIAPRDVIPGTEYAGSIVRAIEAARVMVLIFSGKSNASKHVLREVERAVGRNKIIVPFRVEGVQPSDSMEYFLGIPHWLDALTPPLEAHIERLRCSIEALLQRPAEATEPPHEDQTSLRGRLAAMVWDGAHWRQESLESFQVGAHDAGIEVTNTVRTHYYSRVILAHTLRGDFQSELTLAGSYRDIQLAAATGEDRNLWVNPAEQGIDTSAAQTYYVSRSGGEVEIRHRGRGSLGVGNYRADPLMPCLLSVAIETGRRVRISSWSLADHVA